MQTRFLASVFLLTLLIALALPAAIQSSSIRQVAYELELFELSKSDALIMGVDLPEPLDLFDRAAGPIVQLVHSPGVLQALRAGGDLLRVTATHETDKKIGLAKPQITIAVGQTGTLSLGTEEWIHNRQQQMFETHVSALNVRLTPLRADEEGEQIFTAVEVNSADSAEFITSVWTTSGERVPLGVLTFMQESFEGGQAKDTERSEVRYFAVYMRASAAVELSETPMVQIGSLDRLTGLLWPEEVKAQASSITIAAPVAPFGLPELELDWWVTKTIKFNLEGRSQPSSLALELAGSIVRQELMLLGQLLLSDAQIYLLLGIGDQLQPVPAVTFSAGVYPFSFNASEQTFETIFQWWGRVELSQERLYAALQLEGKNTPQAFQASFGYRLTENDTVFLRYRTATESGLLSVGYRRSF